MEISLIQLPDVQEKKVTFSWSLLSQKTKEVLVTELYRSDALTFKQVRYLLNHSSSQETIEFLEEKGCELYYDRDDFMEDQKTLHRFFDSENT